MKVVIRLVFFFATAPALATGPLGHLSSALGKLPLTGIVDGRLVDEKADWAKHTVMLMTPSTTPNVVQRCTGTAVAGCVLTAAHCVRDGAVTRVYRGRRPDPNASFRQGMQSIALGPPGSDADIAVLKPAQPFPEGFGFSSDVLATKHLDKQGLVDVIGYGLSGTETNDKGERADFGAGVQRVGKMYFSGFGGIPALKDGKLVTPPNGTAILTRRATPDGRVLNVIASGDSGGPLIGPDGKLHGVAVSVGGEAVFPGEAPMAVDRYLGYHASVAVYRARILDALAKLGCGKTGPETPEQAIFRIVRGGLYAFDGQFDPSHWNLMDEDSIEALKRAARSFLGLPAQQGIGLAVAVPPGTPGRFHLRVVSATGVPIATLSVTGDGRVAREP